MLEVSLGRWKELFQILIDYFFRYQTIHGTREYGIWEVICALRFDKEIVFLDYDRKQRDYMHIHREFLRNYRSISDAGTSIKSDKEEILVAAADIFGSLEATDQYFIRMMKECLGMKT